MGKNLTDDSKEAPLVTTPHIDKGSKKITKNVLRKMSSLGDMLFDDKFHKLFQNAKLIEEDLVNKDQFLKSLFKSGILADDPRIKDMVKRFNEFPETKVTLDQFIGCIGEDYNIVEKSMAEKFIIPEFESFTADIKNMYLECKKNESGRVADYIPELANAPPDNWGVSVCSIDGQRVNLGQTDTLFSVQSTSKPISYAIALEDLGPEKVHQHVGHEPSGVSFNAISLNPQGLPHNPLINSGAIMTCSLIQPQMEESQRFSFVTKFWERLAGGKRITYDNTIFLSERNTADTNHALAYLMKSNNAFPKGADIKSVLEFYFQCCSLQADSDTMSVIAATFANGGVNPLTNERILQTSTVKEVLSIMNSCGMYDYSGQFAFNVGLPAKSGVSGGVMIIVPGIMGICTYAPKLDKYGNSARGVHFSKLISQKFGLHYFNIDQNQSLTQKRSRKNNITQELLHFCGLGDLKGIKSLMMESEIDLDIGDYDGRTALHLACSEGQDKVVEYLLKNGVTNINPTDRWGNTPLDDAIRGKFEKIIENMRAHRARTGEDSKRI